MDKKPAPPTSTTPPTPGGVLEDNDPESRRGLFSRFNKRVSEAIETGRGDASAESAGKLSLAPSEALANRRGRPAAAGRMVVPEGATVHGAISSRSETEIAGRVDGDISVEGKLFLQAAAKVKGDVRAASVRNDGLIEGNSDCQHEFELAESGRCNGDVHAVGRVAVSGQVFGNIVTEGAAVLAETAKVNGNIQARQLVINEGAVFNGVCTMPKNAQG